MEARAPEPEDEPDIDALRAFARALIAVAQDVRAARLNSDPATYSDRFKLQKKEGPHRANGRPLVPNPLQEGRDMRSIPRDSDEVSQ
jgi:hypothetical protein